MQRRSGTRWACIEVYDTWRIRCWKPRDAEEVVRRAGPAHIAACRNSKARAPFTLMGWNMARQASRRQPTNERATDYVETNLRDAGLRTIW